MKLALVHKQIGGGGGLEKYLLGLARQLLEAGHEVHVVTQKAELSEAELAGLTIHRMPKLPVLRSARLLKFCRDSKRAAAEIDADAVLGFGQTIDQDIHRAGGGCHRIYSRMLPALKRLSPKNRVELWLEKQLYTSGQTRRFVVNASKVAAELETEYGVDPDSITVIHTPVDSKRFRPAEQTEKAEIRRQLLGREIEEPVFVYGSMDHTRKGLDAILDVWPEVAPDAHLVIAGHGLSPARQAKFEALGDRASFVGQVADMSKLFKAGDVFLHPTLYDACANTVLQAMATGLPAIVSARDGASDFIEDGETGIRLENPEDREELLSKISRVLNADSEELSRIGANARKRMERQTWARHVKDWMEAIERVSY